MNDITIKLNQLIKELDDKNIINHKHIRDKQHGTKDKYFIVVAELPTGTITNHYAIKHWDLFKIPEYEYSITPYDNHTPEDCLKRMKNLIEQTE